MEKPHEHPTHRLLIGVLIAISLLFLVAVVISLNRNDNVTSLAFIKPPELRNFMQQCRDNGGTIDVRHIDAPPVTFVCQYTDRTVEYQLAAGK